MSVGGNSLNGVVLPVAVAARLTKAIVRVVQLCCDGSGDPEFISAAVTICTNLEMDGQIFVLVKIVVAGYTCRGVTETLRAKGSDGEFSAEDVCCKQVVQAVCFCEVPQLDGLASEQEELHGKHDLVQ